MKKISVILGALVVGAGLISASVSPVTPQENQTSAKIQSQGLNSAIKVIPPQKDLETAIRTADRGDILIHGAEGWYRIDGRAMQQGTRVYVLGQGSLVSVFPKEIEGDTAIR